MHQALSSGSCSPRVSRLLQSSLTFQTPHLLSSRQRHFDHKDEPLSPSDLGISLPVSAWRCALMNTDKHMSAPTVVTHVSTHSGHTCQHPHWSHMSAHSGHTCQHTLGSHMSAHSGHTHQHTQWSHMLTHSEHTCQHTQGSHMSAPTLVSHVSTHRDHTCQHPHWSHVSAHTLVSHASTHTGLRCSLHISTHTKALKSLHLHSTSLHWGLKFHGL